MAFPQGTGHTIPGFDQGFGGMKVGGKRRLFIPGNWLRNAQHSRPWSRPSGAPAKSDLIFDVELVDVDRYARTAAPQNHPPMGGCPADSQCRRSPELRSAAGTGSARRPTPAQHRQTRRGAECGSTGNARGPSAPNAAPAPAATPPPRHRTLLLPRPARQRHQPPRQQPQQRRNPVSRNRSRAGFLSGEIRPRRQACPLRRAVPAWP